MKSKPIMGVHAPPPKPTRLLLGALGLFGLAVVILLGLLLDPVLRWVIGLG